MYMRTETHMTHLKAKVTKRLKVEMTLREPIYQHTRTEIPIVHS